LIRHLLAVALAGLLAVASGARAGEIRSDETAAKVCERVAQWKPAGDAVATDADQKQFGDATFCGDWLYRMVGDEYDPVKARRCCLVKGDCNRELAVIFANGLGVRRDYDAATWFLCRADKGMAQAELWGMLGHLEEMRKGSDTKDLAFCDYVTSGRGYLFCEQLAGNRQAERDEKHRARAKDTERCRPREAEGTRRRIQSVQPGRGRLPRRDLARWDGVSVHGRGGAEQR
jgi:TPR repeat protein